MKFSTQMSFGRVVWIRSLASEDIGLSNRVIEDVETILSAKKIGFSLHDVSSAFDLIELLGILANSEVGAGIIIQFDMHGSEADGLTIVPGSEQMSWLALCPILRAINVRSNNNLLVICAVCFGIRLINGLNILEATPFYALIAPEAKITSGFIIDNLPSFYREMIKNSSAMATFYRLLSPQMILYQSEQFFATLLIRYVRDFCIGRAGDARFERLVTKAFEEGLPKNRASLRHARKTTRKIIRPDQALFDEYRVSFLMGKPVTYSMQDILRIAREQEARR